MASYIGNKFGDADTDKLVWNAQLPRERLPNMEICYDR